MKKGYTLSEILITLGIIGVVAAITLPVLHKKTEKFVLQKQFIKFYSNLQSAYNLTIAENGAIFDCYYNITPSYGKKDECSVFYNNVLKNLKVIKTCTGITCLPNYKNDNEVITSGGKRISGGCPKIYDIAAFNIEGKSYILTDGSIIHLHDNYEFGIDINGKKGPNKWGYDVFYIRNMKNNNQIILTDIVCGGLIEPGGVRIKDYLRNNNNYDGDGTNGW